MNMKLDPHIKAAFDEIVAHTPDLGDTPNADLLPLTATRGRLPHHRMLLTAAAAVVVVIGAAGLIAVRSARSDPNDNSPAAQPPATADITSTSQSATSPTPTTEESLDAVRPSPEYFVAVWDAREIVIGECMEKQGYDYLPRPNDAAATGGSWDDWNQWYDEQVAAHPGFGPAFQGSPDAQAGGCQLEAFRAVHGPGEEAYSKAATLENELRADTGGLDIDQPAVDQWVADHAEAVDRIRVELDEELQTARRIIANSNP